MAEKKQHAKQVISQTIKCGGVVAEICQFQGNTGFEYFAFRVERSFTTSTGKQTRGTVFFAKNAQEICQVAQEAAAWINARQQADLNVNREADSPGV
jgi:hypothetical protein